MLFDSSNSLALFCITSAALLLGPVQGQLICNLTSDWVQAVIPSARLLYLIVGSNLYQLPFDRSHISNAKGRIKLFGKQFIRHGHWSTFDLFKPVSTIELSYYKGVKTTLVQLNQLVDAFSSQQLYLDVILAPETKQYMEHFLLKLHGKEEDRLPYKLGNSTEKYAFFSDGLTGGYILRMGHTWALESSILTTMAPVGREWDDILRLPELPFVKGAHPSIRPVTDPTVKLFRVTFPTSGKITMRRASESDIGQPTETTKPLKASKVFGFLFSGHIHVWDLKNRLVNIFIDSVVADRVVPLVTVPMVDYFCCNATQWDDADVTEQPVRGPSITMILAISFTVGLGGLVGSLLVWLSCRARRKCKRYSSARQMTVGSSAAVSQVSSVRPPTRTPGRTIGDSASPR